MNFFKKNKKYISFCLSVLIFLLPISKSFAESKLDIDAKSAILIDSSSGEIIYEKKAHERLHPASITKIMVLLLTMESIEKNEINLEDEVTISANAAGMGGSQVYLEEGEVQNVEELLTAICLRSANDASVAMAEYISGSEESFINKMNERAKELGMKNTSFKNATGLPAENHYTSAYDISIMARELLKYTKIHEWLTVWMKEMKVGKDKEIVQGLVNTNRLIKEYEGANGIKTGSTQDAGFCLAASAERGNLKLISVVLGCETSKIRFDESKKLLDYGFSNYDSVTIARKNDIIDKVLVQKGNVEKADVVLEKDAYILLPKDSKAKVEKEIILPKSINAPVDKGKKVGEMILSVDGKEIQKINLLINNTIDKAGFKNMFKKSFNKLLTQ
ncbi:MAG: D-alanyl-D-alanine carboxypeptidase [Clostridiaceae bacterium]|nr:D-alanyl-D-alanine carboxypeptidase [Clostridiaceae bacterium]MBW4859896.1 D-alanyl-D-alanine carboxypeptidase [Clostridiaceae bacterium]MBW4869674.1 D-alanyl-D-alanine carboxypeptidase [Clostridiaceae bacterium]